MIKELIIECEEITLIETHRTLGNNIQVTLSKANMDFLEQADTKEIIGGLDIAEMMEAIVDTYGDDFITDWLNRLGK